MKPRGRSCSLTKAPRQERMPTMHCGSSWQPTAVTRVIEPILSSTCVVRVATDAGVGFLKGMGNPQGNESLASELVGSELAAALGLTLPPFAVIEVAGIDIPLIKGGSVAFGPAFISRALTGSPGDQAGTFLTRLANPGDIPRLVAFDTWTRNLDRCPPPDYLDPTPKWDNLLFTPLKRRFQLVVFDHTHCFVEGELEDGLAGDHFVEDPRVYGAFPEFLPFLSEAGIREACERIRRVDARTIVEIIGVVPAAWGPTAAVRGRWAEQLVNRARRVEDFLMAALVPQLQIKV